MLTVVTGGDNTSRVPDHSPILSWLLNRRRCVERLAFRRFKVRAAHALEFRRREHGGHARPACCCEPSTDEDTFAICFAWCALHDVRHAGPTHVATRTLSVHTPLAIQTGYADYQPLFSAVAGLLAAAQLRALRFEACDVSPTLLPQGSLPWNCTPFPPRPPWRTS